MGSGYWDWDGKDVGFTSLICTGEHLVMDGLAVSHT